KYLASEQHISEMLGDLSLRESEITESEESVPGEKRMSEVTEESVPRASPVCGDEESVARARSVCGDEESVPGEERMSEVTEESVPRASLVCGDEVCLVKN
ncbi:Hypothetical predicted protein, partial [Paramuricea clavata]